MGVSAVIVTYNRKEEVLRCIKAVLNQSLQPENIIVVNNASTDGTAEYLEKNIKDSRIKLLNLEKNTGGAGGFYSGLKYARETFDSDFYWLMDDDGYPDVNCLEILLSKIAGIEYVMPVSLDINNPEKLSWFIHKPDRKKTDDYAELKKAWGEILDWVVPFNGVLLSKKCVQEAGYINPDFFIWGDDYEHYYRCKKQGFKPVTILEAKFFHPSQTSSTCRMFFGLLSISYSSSKLRMYCMIRNWTYIYMHYGQKYKIPVKFLMYFWFFIFTRHFDFSGLALYLKSLKDGLKEDFSRHFDFLK